MSKWNNETLVDVSTIITGPFGSQLHQADYKAYGTAVIMPQNISNRTVSFENIAYINDEDAERLKRYLVKVNDMVYSRRGDVEKHAFIDDNLDGLICGTGCLRVRFNTNKVHPNFISHFLNRIESRKWLVNHAIGYNMPNLNTGILSALPISYPEDMNEQIRISKCLNLISQKIQLNNKINETLQEQASLLYDYWFTQFDFPDENGKPYKSSGGKMVYNEALKREIPEGWEVKSLGEITRKNTTSFDYNSTQPTIDLSVMPSGSISLNQINSSDEFSTNLFLMNEGDILFGSIRPYLKKAGIAPCNGAIAGTVHSYRVDNINNYNFALFTLSRDSFFEYAVRVSTGTKMPVVSSDNVLAYKVPYSHSVAKLFSKINIKTIICKNNQETQELIALRDWLLPMLMNGQATVAEEQKPIFQVIENGTKNEQPDRFALWLQNQGLAARGDIDRQTLREIFDAMDDDDK